MPALLFRHSALRVPRSEFRVGKGLFHAESRRSPRSERECPSRQQVILIRHSVFAFCISRYRFALGHSGEWRSWPGGVVQLDESDFGGAVVADG